MALSDSQKEEQGLNVFTDEKLIAQNPALSVFSRNYKGEKSHETMAKALKECDLQVW